MTPKFDNLASLLIEMPTGVPITDEEKLEIAQYIEQFPEDTYEDIADAFGVAAATVFRIARELDVRRGLGAGSDLKGHIQQAIVDDLKKHPEDGSRVIGKRHGVSKTSVNNLARKHGISRPRGPVPMRRTADRRKKEHAVDPTGIITQRPIVHHLGTTIYPPKPPGESK